MRFIRTNQVSKDGSINRLKRTNVHKARQTQAETLRMCMYLEKCISYMQNTLWREIGREREGKKTGGDGKDHAEFARLILRNCA